MTTLNLRKISEVCFIVKAKFTPEGMTLMAGYVFNCRTLDSVSALSAPAVEPWTFEVPTEVVTARPAKTPIKNLLPKE